MRELPSFADPPFACPPDPPSHLAEPVVVELPAPPSVNQSRKIDWRNHQRTKHWIEHCDGLVLSGPRITGKRIPRFELHIVLSEQHTKVDLDNALKSLIDYLVRIEVIADDGRRNMRRVIVEWGEAPLGAKITVTPLP